MRNWLSSVMRRSRCKALFLLVRIQIIDQIDPALRKWLMRDVTTLLAEWLTDVVRDEREI